MHLVRSVDEWTSEIRRRIAKVEGVTEAYVRRLLDIALLAPSLVEDALQGRRFSSVTTTYLRSRAQLPFSGKIRRAVSVNSVI